MSQPRLYFAGPDVFGPGWAQQRRHLAMLAQLFGAIALLPVDGEGKSARDIVHGNLERLSSAHAVIANLTPFRGAEPDAGTVVEAVEGLAGGKVVIGWSRDLRPMVDRVEGRRVNGRFVDRDGRMVEDFGYALNIMLAERIPLVGCAAEAIAIARARLRLRPEFRPAESALARAAA